MSSTADAQPDAVPAEDRGRAVAVDASGAAPDAGAERVDGRDARWAAHRSSRRAELVREARRAVHRLGPELSMDELAGQLGTSKSIVYRYFTDKSGLQAAVGAAVIDDLREVIAEATAGLTRPRELIAAMIDVYLGFVESSAHVYAYVTQPEAAAGAVRGFVAETEDIVAEALLPVLGSEEDDDARAVAALWASGVVGLARASVERWVAARGGRGDVVEDVIAGLDRTQLAAYLTDWLWEGAVGVARRLRTARPATPEPSVPGPTAPAPSPPAGR